MLLANLLASNQKVDILETADVDKGHLLKLGVVAQDNSLVGGLDHQAVGLDLLSGEVHVAQVEVHRVHADKSLSLIHI